jgi:hypothetical protein
VDVQNDLAEILAINCLACGVFVGKVAHKMLYFSIENLVFWARSVRRRRIGFASQRGIEHRA